MLAPFGSVGCRENIPLRVIADPVFPPSRQRRLFRPSTDWDADEWAKVLRTRLVSEWAEELRSIVLHRVELALASSISPGTI